MLTPNYLENLPHELVEILSNFEMEIASDIARRLAKFGKITEATEWQIQMFTELGGLNTTVNKVLKKYDPVVRKKLLKLFKEATIKSAQKDLAQYNKAVLSDNQKQVIETTIKKLANGKISEGSAHATIISGQFQKTYQGVVRLTQTIAKNAETIFVSECNDAYMKVASGAFDYNTAIKGGVKNLAKNNITKIKYNFSKNTRTVSIESAVRMNVMTGINQVCAQITESDGEALGCDLVEVDAHAGARPSHADWQGGIYSRSGKSDKYQSFEVCGLGAVDGICGINCKHSYYNYFEGQPRHYDAETLKKMNAKDVSFNGKKMTRYEANQKLRLIERQIRKWKRKAGVLKAGGEDVTKAKAKIKEWQERARDFTKKTGLKRDYKKEFVSE